MAQCWRPWIHTYEFRQVLDNLSVVGGFMVGGAMGLIDR